MSRHKPVHCPKCATDVMVTGFTLRAETSTTWMRFNEVGPVQIASTQKAADRAECGVCGAALKEKPADLMRAA